MLKISRDKLFFVNDFAGAYSRGATPDPISNSEVKASCGDGIAWFSMWESSAVPAFYFKNRSFERFFFAIIQSKFFPYLIITFIFINSEFNKVSAVS